jgi:broad specificity phosphatase PhoE
MTRLYLLRHGATASNRQLPYRLQGQRTDHPLDSLGQAQAALSRDVLAHVKFAAAFSSPLLRAMETARIIVERSGLAPVPITELTEAELGRWEGLTWDEARARDPEHHERFMANPGTVPYPGGESFLEVQNRAAPALATIAERHPGATVLVVGHNVVNRAYLALPLGLPIDRARSIRQSNGGINIVEIDGSTASVLCLNSCLHLDGLSE